MKIKKLEYTEHGYSYLKCKQKDCFDWGGFAICDYCGEVMTDDVYLIFILGSAYCPKCFNDWIKRTTRYEDDIQLQEQNQERWYKFHGFNII